MEGMSKQSFLIEECHDTDHSEKEESVKQFRFKLQFLQYLILYSSECKHFITA